MLLVAQPPGGFGPPFMQRPELSQLAYEMIHIKMKAGYTRYGVLEIIYYDFQSVPVSQEVTTTLFVETENCVVQG